MEMPVKSMERLIALKEKTESASYSEVVRNSLRLYESIIAQYESGSTLLIRSSDGVVKEYEIFC